MPTTIAPALAGYDRQLSRVAEYISAVSPGIVANRDAVPVFVESMMVVVVARLEHFLTSLVAGAVRDRESAARSHFQQHGNPDERLIAQSCDLRTLIRMARRRLSFQKRGKSIATIFAVLFGFSPWPSSAVLLVISDLVLLRNVFVHEGDTVMAEHATQANHKDLFTSRSYGEFTVYSVDYVVALPFLRSAIVALKDQSDYLRAQLVNRPE